ncbi:ABC transporter substrate-binding protein [Nannocystis sp. ILAH1]|uniref:MlaC/ttg2D family ABC transporter substrate-binding protein n=1 Tax=unclassified Nannocystis TaxID=2627009 RepID=UPI00226EFF2D|nr:MULTISPECIES: ABC transporter substrate-binding protein [unclassified Nannocystis]MCY0994667.1 ABC transporter substrate-binding protein [Nannocystis sp. ILAH1]MCY1068101.1 ABC transporter substrate-binding protein [Nannocystis sp. RBIL2]
MPTSARSLIAGFVLSTFVFFGHAPAADAANTPASPSAVFKERHNKVLELVKKRADPETLAKEVDQLLDYKALAEASLGGPARYANKCAPRCAEFDALLTKLIRENYLKRLRSDKKYELTIVGEDAKVGGDIRVITNIALTRDGKPEVVEVVYVMHAVGDTWKVEDIITDGVSLAKNYKFEFNKIIRDKGVDELILRLENKLVELAKKN